MYVVYLGIRLYYMWYLYMIGRLYDFYDGVACCIPLLTGTVYLNVAAKVINHNRWSLAVDVKIDPSHHTRQTPLFLNGMTDADGVWIYKLIVSGEETYTM